jgi:hypothetical protein
MLDTRTVALLAPRASEPNLEREAIQLADLRAALSTRVTRSLVRTEHPRLLFRRSDVPTATNCDCAA